MLKPRVPTKGWRGWTMLDEARSEYLAHASPHYDEVLDEAAERFRANGSLDKADIDALVKWERLRGCSPWVTKLHSTPDSEVHAKTAAAYAAVNDRTKSRAQAAGDGRRALLGPAVFNHGAALASAVLLAAAPDRMAVYDRRAQRALDHELQMTIVSSAGLYQGYMQVIDDLVVGQQERGNNWTARDVDLSLFQLGGSR